MLIILLKHMKIELQFKEPVYLKRNIIYSPKAISYSFSILFLMNTQEKFKKKYVYAAQMPVHNDHDQK